MAYYKNLGAPIRRGGETVAHRGEVFEPTDDELARKAYKLRAVPAPDFEPASDVDTSEVETVSEDDVEQYHTGNGWYSLPGGERVRGKEDAAARLSEIHAANE